MTSSKLISVLLGIIAATAIATTPLAAFAQAPQPQPSTQAPQPQTKPSSRPRIVLSEEQQSKFEQIQVNAIAQIEKVLNADQKNQFAAGRENGQGLGAIQNLSDAQKSDIKKILEAANSDIGNILTQEQKDLIRQSQAGSQQ
jgi:hypothetical protein